jgi:hypothetical protein
VSLTVEVVDNTALHVQDQAAAVRENGAVAGINPLVIDLLANDTGLDLLVTGLTQPAHGSVDAASLNTGMASYAPDPDFAGTDTFTYTVLDGNGQTATANVVVTVVGPDTPLAAHDDTVAAPAASPVILIDVLGNDTGSGVHVTAVTQGANGAAAILPAGIGVTYQPNQGFSGTDKFTYTITDANGQTATATVTVRVVTSLAPTARVTGPATGEAGQVLIFTLGASNVTGDPAAGFTYVVDWGDHSPALTIPATAGNGAGMVASHTYAAVGSFTVQVTATNRDGLSSPVATTPVTITMPNPPPPPPAPHPVGVTLVSRTVGKGPHRSKQLYAQVNSSTGQTRLILSPLQAPRYRSVACTLTDLDGDGILDAVIFTGRDARSGKKVRRILRL